MTLYHLSPSVAETERTFYIKKRPAIEQSVVEVSKIPLGLDDANL